MSADQGLSFAITADGSSASAEIQNLEARLTQLEAAFKASGEGASVASSGIEKVGVVSKDASSGLEAMAAHAGTVGRALSALGFDAEAAGARVEGMLGVMKELSSAVPELLAIGAAFVAISSAASFMKDSISLAAEWDQRLQILGQTIRNQGGDWDAMREKVIAWADVQEKTTQFSRDEAVQALTQLTATGMSASDAMKVIGVAEDAAAATGLSLTAVEHGLMEAMHGRAQALTQLGIGTKQSIHDGMKFQDVLNAIEQHMGGAATAAADTYAGKLKEMQHAVESLQEDLGNLLLPALTNVVDHIKSFVDEVDRDLPQIKQQFGSVLTAVSDVINFLVDHKDQVEFFFDVLIAQRAVLALTALRTGFITAMAAGGAFTTVVETMESVFTVGLIPTMDAVVASLGAIVTEETAATFGLNLLIAGSIAGAIYAFQHWQEVLQVTQFSIGQLENAIGSLVDDLLGWIPGVHAFAQSLEDMGMKAQIAAAQIRDLHAAQNGDKGKADMGAASSGAWGAPTVSDALGSTMVGGKLGGAKHGSAGAAGYNAQAIQAATIDETALANAHKALGAAADDASAAQAALAAKIIETMDSQQQQSIAMKKLQESYDAARASIPRLIDEIKSEKDAEHGAQSAVQATHEAYTKAVAALNAYEKSLEGKTKLTAAEKNELNALKDAVKASDTEYKSADKTLKDITKTLDEHNKMLATATKQVNAFALEQQKLVVALNDAKEKEQQKVADEKAIYGMSLDQLAKYYAERYAMAVKADQDYYDEHHTHLKSMLDDEAKYYVKSIDANFNAWKKRQDDTAKAEQQEETSISNFLDDIIVKHKTFKDEFKSIWNEIETIFIDDIAKMIAESSAFNTILKNLLGSNAGGGLAGIIGSLFGGQHNPGGGIINGPVGAGADLSSLLIAPGSSSSSALAVTLTGASSGSGLDKLFGGGSGGGLGALAMGAGIGGLVGGFEGAGSGAKDQHATWGAVGGLLGVGALGLAAGWGSGMGAGLAALLGAGPAGWALLLGAGLLGGAAGGLFGPNWGPPSNYPDRSDTQNYGQFVADWTGAPGSFNGQTIAPLQQYNGKSNDEAAQMLAWAQANPNDPLSKQLLALGSTQQQLDITNEHNGVFTLGDGKQISVTDLENLVNQWQQQTGGTTTVPTFTLTHSFPDWQNPQLALGGNFNGPPGSVQSPGGPIGSHPGAPGAPGGPGGGNTHPQPPTIHVRVDLTTGALVGVTKDSLVKAVSESVADEVRRIPLTRFQTTF